MAPPLIGVAENVTEVPEQIVVAEGLTFTLGVTTVFTPIVIILLVALAGVAQGSLEVITTLTWFALAKVVDV